MKMTHDAMKMRNGTSLQGYVNAHYSQLVEMFGEPYTNPGNHKTDVEWIVSTPYGPATVYNYKNGPAYLGKSGLRLDEIKQWHVSAKNYEAFVWLRSHFTVV